MIHLIIWPIISGLLLGFSQPIVIEAFGPTPFNHALFGLMSFVGYIPAILAMDRTRIAGAFWLGWFSTFIQYMIILYWFVIAMTVFGGVSIWLSIAVLALTCSAIAALAGAAFAVTKYLSIRFRWPVAFVLPAAVTAVDYLRNYGLVGGFPWGNVGYSLAGIPVLLQIAAWVGIYGLVFYVVLVNTTIASVYKSLRHKHQITKRLVAVTSILTVFVLGYGIYRLQTFDVEKQDSIKVALLQGNIEQGIKNKAQLYYDEILGRYRELQRVAVEQKPDVVIWPEASLPGVVPSHIKNFSQLNLAHAPAIVMGAVIRDNRDFTNSALVLDQNFDLVGRFDKTHLVPFGEYVPWPFKGIVAKIVPGMGAFKPAHAFVPIPLKIRDDLVVPIGTTICYEGVFPEISRDFAKAGAKLLVNLTNDAWYGVSSAPYQHLRMYSVRAVETGRSYARATNTGVTAWVDPRGGVHQPTSLYVSGITVADVPVMSETTVYVMFGDVIAYCSLVFMLVAWLLAILRKDVLVRGRSIIEWALAIFSYGLVIAANRYFSASEFAVDEAAKTKLTVITTAGLVVGTAALSGRPWGRHALIWTGAAIAILAGLLTYVDSNQFVLAMVIGIVVLVLGLFRKRAFKQE